MHRSTPFTLDGIALGCWLAWLERSHPDRFAKLARFAPWAVAASLAAIVGLAVSGIRAESLIALGRSPAALLGGALVVLARVGLWNRLLEFPFLRHAGARCYALYLLHPLPLVSFRVIVENARKAGTSAPGWTFALLTVGTLAASFAIAEISWRVIEEPALRLKRYLPYRGRRHAPDLAEVATGR